MKIYYQGNPGSYMHIASRVIQKDLNVQIEAIEWKPDFRDVWESIGTENIAVLAIENSYMGSIHPNLHGFLKYDCKIVGQYDMYINHCLCSKETDIEKITKAYSQMPALEQCHKYLKTMNIEPMVYSDTSLAAKHVSETQDSGKAAICSELAAEIYGLNILQKNIQDHSENTTRFAVIADKKLDIAYSEKENKISIMFEVEHIPSKLYECLGIFAKRSINLTKLESLPSFRGKFLFMFWMDIQGNLSDPNISSAFEELQEYVNELRIIGEY